MCKDKNDNEVNEHDNNFEMEICTPSSKRHVPKAKSGAVGKKEKDQFIIKFVTG